MYGGTFTDDAHTKYTADSAENIKAIQTLYDTDGINFDASIAGGDEITLFRNGTLQMAFCWNIAQQLNSDNNDAGLTNSGDEIMPMAFPTASGDPKLCGGIWGFGVFDNGDEAKVKAAKTFIEFIAADPDQVKDQHGVTREWINERTNINGGAIALGHPIGASGNRIVVSLVHEMINNEAKLGLASLCIGGGMGTALILKKC